VDATRLEKTLTTLRAYVAGMTHETNTFSPVPTSAASFNDGSWRPSRGGPPLPPHSLDTLGYGHFVELCAENGVHCSAGPFLHAGPSGTLVARDHLSLRDEILQGLTSAGPVDMVFLFMHGAQVAEGCDDVEGDLVAAVRRIVGPVVPIGLVLDLHGNVSEAMLKHALVIGCLEYPHTDYAERTRQAFDLLCAAARGTCKPVTRAWRLPIVGLYATTSGPMQAFVARLRALQASLGILSISAFHGFLLADARGGRR
jgi:microcystin degradation protein MlrC